MKNNFLIRKYFIQFVSIIFFALSFFSCSSNKGQQTKTFLGTVCSINLFDDGSKKNYDETFKILKDVENKFSVHISNSEISKINKASGKEAVKVSEDVFFVIQKALYYAEFSDGDFDPTVGPLVELWGIGTDKERVPSEEEIENALTFVDWHDVELNFRERSVFLKKEGMALDLGGITKGYAADLLVDFLIEKNIERAVINLGGNVYVYGKKEDNSPWRVGIKNPYNSEASPALALALNSSTSVVTSGDYERYIEKDGIRFHHIIDPHTGYSAKSSVHGATIILQSSCDADALSTIAFIQGRKKFKETLNSIGQVIEGYVFIEKNNAVYACKSLENYLTAYDSIFKDIKFE